MHCIDLIYSYTQTFLSQKESEVLDVRVPFILGFLLLWKFGVKY